MRKLPSTQALRAIESFARHGKVWQVADELNLTRSAVSHQLRLLESDLGFQILNRVGTGVELTQRGHAYAKDIRKALNIITSSAVRNASAGIGGKINISCAPGFASSWLCLNIGKFKEAYSDVTISLTTPQKVSDISDQNVDIFITFGRDFSADAEIELLKRIESTPLCSPAYLNKFDGFSNHADLQQATLLHLSDYQDWEDWNRAIGQPIEFAQKGIIFNDLNLVYSAALASQGIAIGDEFLCSDAIKKGQLVAPFDRTLPCEGAYYIAIPYGKSLTPAHTAFLEWLKDELARNS
ncbi:LysR substrate-binding domain-containing protein [Vibrio sp. RC27]